MDSPPRSVLMLAFYFPPFDASTGSQRVLSLARHLPPLGWRPIVITAREAAYSHTDPATLTSIPAGTTVLRAFAFDIARKLSIRGLYPRTLATPDRWNSWILGALATGLKAIRTHRPSALWATFPIPSAIAAGLLLKRASGLPLIGDLRDPMVYDAWPATAWERRWYAYLERMLVRRADAIVVTTPGAARLYRDRYPAHRDKFCVIPNGMEPPNALPTPRPAAANAPITLLHSGQMDVPDRDPRQFFAALRELSDKGGLGDQRVRVILRASGLEALYEEAVRAQGVEHLVEILPRISRAQALEEMRDASALMIFQGRECNNQIPAKAYEYLFLGKPIICLADTAGDTYALVHDEWGVPYCASMDDPADIARALSRFFADHRTQNVYVPPASLQSRHTRQTQAVAMAALLDKTVQATTVIASRASH